MSFFRIENVAKTFGEHQALRPFSIDLPKGQFLAIVGESGSGKSTLLRIMAGLEVQDSGEVWLGDMRIENPKEKLVSGYDKIKLIHQDYHLYPNSTVEENISRPLLSFDQSYRKKRVESLLKLLKLDALRARFPRELSGGQQQKVAIAKAMSVEPDVLLLDEPFSSLDPIQTYELMGELKFIFQTSGTTVILVTHDLDHALSLTDNLLILKKGKVVQKGDSKSLCTAPKSEYVARLFSPINALSGEKKAFIRPSDVKLRSSRGELAHVVDSRFLVHYNSLQIKIKETQAIWEVDDPDRRFQVGDRVYVSWEEEKVLRF
ncbi:ABC transporter ATP-binding protein [Algoriphagus namhaensis]